MEKNLSGSLGGVIDEMLSGSVAGNIQFESAGSGSNITITPTLESGTKIADFTIDDASGSIYAPTPTEYEAGNNVTIEDGVISATDTTYTAGDGITIENGVISCDITPEDSTDHYLQSDGNQYIITDFKLGYNQTVEVVYSENGFNSADWESMLGNQDANVVNSYDITRNLDSNKISCQYGNNNYHEFADYNQLYTKRKILMTRQGNCFVDNIYKSTKTSDNFTPNCNLGIFCKNMNNVPSNKFNGRIYSIKIWNSSDILIHHLIADNSENTPNLYDVVTDTHYYNDGSGNFIFV